MKNTRDPLKIDDATCYKIYYWISGKWEDVGENHKTPESAKLRIKQLARILKSYTKGDLKVVSAVTTFAEVD